MSWESGAFNVANNINCTLSSPWDARTLAPNINVLTDNSIPSQYKGMSVVVNDDESRSGGDVANNGMYILTGTDSTSIASWTKIGSGSGSSLSVGIDDGDVLQCDTGISDDNFLRIKGDKVEGLDLSDLQIALGGEDAGDLPKLSVTVTAGQLLVKDDSPLTTFKGIANTIPTVGLLDTNVLPSAGVQADNFLRVHTSNGKVSGLTKSQLQTELAGLNNNDLLQCGTSTALETDENGAVINVKKYLRTHGNNSKVVGRTLAQFQTELAGITNGSLLQSEGIDDDDFLRVKSSKIEGLTKSELQDELGGNSADDLVQLSGQVTDGYLLVKDADTGSGETTFSGISNTIPTKGIVDTNVFESAGVDNSDFLKVQASGNKVEGVSLTELKTELNVLPLLDDTANDKLTINTNVINLHNVSDAFVPGIDFYQRVNSPAPPTSSLVGAIFANEDNFKIGSVSGHIKFLQGASSTTEMMLSKASNLLLGKTGTNNSTDEKLTVVGSIRIENDDRSRARTTTVNTPYICCAGQVNGTSSSVNIFGAGSGVGTGSVTRVSTGGYTCTFDTPRGSANYCVHIQVYESTNADDIIALVGDTNQSTTGFSYLICEQDNSGSAGNPRDRKHCITVIDSEGF